MNRETFIKELEKLNISINEEKLEQLGKYANFLIEYNKHTNLTAITDLNDIYLKHFYDSLTIVRNIDLNKVNTLCDVGTGAGFPGIVLKIVYPNLKITLVDALQKRVNYLNEIIKELDLSDIVAIHSRGEDLKEKYDIVTARAVANITKLLNYTMHLVEENGVFIAMKGNITEELTPAVQKAISKKYSIEKIEEFYLPYENSQRSLVVIKNKH